MADRVWKKIEVRSCQLSQNKFLDPSTPSIRKGCDGGKGGKQAGAEQNPMPCSNILLVIS